MNTLLFIYDAWRYGAAFIDVDGCILKKYPVPAHIPDEDKLEWWHARLAPTPIVWRRVLLCYVLYFLGVNLIVWTNRDVRHFDVTRIALGRHIWIFKAFMFYSGGKGKSRPLGPVMDDQESYLSCGLGRGLLVKSL